MSTTLLALAFATINVNGMQTHKDKSKKLNLEEKVKIKGTKNNILYRVAILITKKIINDSSSKILEAIKNPSEIFSPHAKIVGTAKITRKKIKRQNKVGDDAIIYSCIYQNRKNKNARKKIGQNIIVCTKRIKINNQKEKETIAKIIKLLKSKPNNTMAKKDFRERVDFLLSLE